MNWCDYCGKPNALCFALPGFRQKQLVFFCRNTFCKDKWHADYLDRQMRSRELRIAQAQLGRETA